MAIQTPSQIETLFRESFLKIKGTRTSGWEADDSEKTALLILEAQTDKEGKPIKFSKEATARIGAALRLTPKRILNLIDGEIVAAGGALDGLTAEHLLLLCDHSKFHQGLVRDALLVKNARGKKKRNILEALK